jgi:hypothetical protein
MAGERGDDQQARLIGKIGFAPEPQQIDVATPYTDKAFKETPDNF